jgi:putative DNA primase/helicase
MHTKSAGFIPVKGEIPRFCRFLNEITCGDKDLVVWIVRWMGYCLTEDVKAAYFANFYGVGGNGKGVLIRLLRKIMGDYAVTLSSKAVVQQGLETEGRFDRSDLPGARLAVVEDAPAGRLAEEFVKTLTGEGKMYAEEKYHKAYEFSPKAKLIIASNNQLKIKDTGTSMRRRLRTVPFNFLPAKPDVGLEAALMKEAPAILAMLIDEAGDYLANPGPAGFPYCKIIEDASKEYIDSQDTVRLFLNDKTEPGDGVKASELFNAYKTWCEDNGYKAANSTKFGLDLKRCGIERKHTMTGNNYQNIVIKLNR